MAPSTVNQPSPPIVEPMVSAGMYANISFQARTRPSATYPKTVRCECVRRKIWRGAFRHAKTSIQPHPGCVHWTHRNRRFPRPHEGAVRTRRSASGFACRIRPATRQKRPLQFCKLQRCNREFQPLKEHRRVHQRRGEPEGHDGRQRHPHRQQRRNEWNHTTRTKRRERAHQRGGNDHSTHVAGERPGDQRVSTLALA